MRSSISRSCICFADQLSCGPFEKWKTRWWDETFNYTSGGIFDYVIMIDTEKSIVTVLEMDQRAKSKHAHLMALPAISTHDDFRLQLGLSPHVQQALYVPTPDRGDGSVPMKFNWYPFEPPEEPRATASS